MIALNGIAKQYGGRYLFKGLSLRLGDDERIGLVGVNGSGKSTLMKIILGVTEPDAGEIIRSRSHSAGYLPQEGVLCGDQSLYDEAASAFEEINALHRRAEQLAGDINSLAGVGSDSPELRSLVDELGKIQHRLEHLEGYNIKVKVEEVLFGLGFRESDLARPVSEFSGGWQMRLALAKLLLAEPGVLMLDEPTNHLDLESLEWLESYLRSYRGSVVIISHDRRFLDNLTRRTLELASGRLDDYRGNFSAYVEAKAAREEMLRAKYDNQREKIKAAMLFVDRFRFKATKARQVQSRLKALEKIELEEPETENGGITFDFPEPPVPGRILVSLKGVTKAYRGLELFSGLDFQVERGDRIAFVGVNGAGKSTLARILAGQEEFQAGSRSVGHKVTTAFFAQHRAEELDPAKTVLATIEEVAVHESLTRLRSLLGCFLFTGDDVFKTVSVLSGGEKSRLALARLLLLPANLLILDEPTNHLDMRSKAVLQAALGRFAGSYVIVSHDRDFLAPLVTKVAEFKDGTVRLHLGGVDDFMEKVRRQREADASHPAMAGASMSPLSGARSDKERKRQEAAKRQERYRKIEPLRQSIASVEQRIAAAEIKKTEVETALASDKAYKDGQARALSLKYRDITTTLAYLYEEWTRLQEELEDSAP